MPIHSKFAEIVIPQVSFWDYIFTSLQQGGNRAALIEARSGRTLTFSRIADEAVKCASAFYRRGLRRGDIFAICALNSPEYVIVVLAAAACGATITTCNPLSTTDELKHQFGDSQPSQVFVSRQMYQKIRDKPVSSVITSIKKIYTFGEVEGVESYRNLVIGDDGSAFPDDVDINPNEDILFLPYSSGTTGLPKGVMLTHRNFVATISMNRAVPFFTSDCMYHVLPLFHSYGLYVSFMGLDQGFRQVMDVRFSLDTFLSYVEKYKITRVRGVPPMFLVLAKSQKLRNYDLSSLVTIFSGAAPLPPDVADTLRQKLGVLVAQGNHKSFFIEVIDEDTGRELGPYENGELCVKGPQVLKGYFKNPTATESTIDTDGWLHTGDVGYYDDNELIYIVDRLKELIKYKGFQVAPAELEAVLVSHPKIADAAVVGVPDSLAGEVARAFIVPIKEGYLTKREVHEFLAGKVSKYKYLHGGIEFRSSIQKSASGKILRKLYRKEIAGKAKI